MKKLILLFTVCAPVSAYAQIVSGKTNKIALDYKSGVSASVLPAIVWNAPRTEFTHSTESRIEIEAEINGESPVAEITLAVINNLNQPARKMEFDRTSIRHVIKQRLILVEGTNIIRVTAVNNNGGRVVSERTVSVGKDALVNVDPNRKDYALVFATDRYENFSELVNPVDDSRTIEGLLKEKYGFITEVVENPTLQEITNKIYDYSAKKYGAQDQLFVFFAGHGIYDAVLDQGYVVASDSRKDDKGKVSYLPYSVLRTSLDKISCQHIFLTMDVCFGGTFDERLTDKRADMDEDESAEDRYLAQKLSIRTRKFLTSGGKDYVSDGIKGKHSPFAAKFIQALREIGGGGGRLLTLMELNTYFQKLAGEPRFGPFGSDGANSDFVFVAR